MALQNFGPLHVFVGFLWNVLPLWHRWNIDGPSSYLVRWWLIQRGILNSDFIETIMRNHQRAEQWRYIKSTYGYPYEHPNTQKKTLFQKWLTKGRAVFLGCFSGLVSWPVVGQMPPVVSWSWCSFTAKCLKRYWNLLSCS
jgi:hypothetical protein